MDDVQPAEGGERREWQRANPRDAEGSERAEGEGEPGKVDIMVDSKGEAC